MLPLSDRDNFRSLLERIEIAERLACGLIARFLNPIPNILQSRLIESGQVKNEGRRLPSITIQEQSVARVIVQIDEPLSPLEFARKVLSVSARLPLGFSLKLEADAAISTEWLEVEFRGARVWISLSQSEIELAERFNSTTTLSPQIRPRPLLLRVALWGELEQLTLSELEEGVGFSLEFPRLRLAGFFWDYQVISAGVFMTAERIDIESQTGEIRLELGSIELSLNDLMRLKPGVNVEFEMPINRIARLKLGDMDVGGCTVQLTEGRVTLRITELAWQRPAKLELAKAA